MENRQGAPGSTGQASNMDPKTIAIIAYLTLIGTIVALVINNDEKNEYASFHIKQGLGLGLSLIVLNFLLIVPIIGWIAYVVGLIFIGICWVIGLIGALKEEETLVPIVGEKYQEWFHGL